MKTTYPSTAEWLEILKTEKNYETDAEAAAFLDVSKQSIRQWAKGQHEMDTASAWRLGLGIGVHPLFVIACCGWHKAKPNKRKRWELLAAPLEPKTVEAAKARKA